jgi:hypothetical protein
MKPAELREEIAVEIEALEAIASELSALQKDVAGGEPTVREKTAAAAFLAQFYNGIENILKRISSYHAVPLPTGDTWHIDLFERFCSPPYSSLPVLFGESLASTLAPYRRFRHVAFHAYGFQLDWSRLAEGVAGVPEVLQRVKASLADYMQTIDAGPASV